MIPVTDGYGKSLQSLAQRSHTLRIPLWQGIQADQDGSEEVTAG